MSPDAPDLITVSALLARVESRIETLATGWWITGEVAEAKVSAANHCYFTLRDEGGQIRCVLFAGVLKSLEAAGDFEIRAGDKLEVAGSLMVYPRSGDLQLRVLRVRRAGMGALYEAFLRLRAKLEAEGLFRPERKKPLPAFVRHVCVLTSSKGAALHDVLTTLKRRTPWIRITFANVLVQGADAPGSICRGLRAADECGADLLLLVRGGGSFEDLNAFNDETLARTIASLKIPVIAGIGHETDVTIAELVADRRASTPTAAAEAVGPELSEWTARLLRSEHLLVNRVTRDLRLATERVDRASFALADPERAIRSRRERLLRAASLLVTPEDWVRRRRERLAELAKQLDLVLARQITENRYTLQSANETLDAAVLRLLAQRRRELADREAILASHNPDLPLKKGYVTVRDGKKRVLTRLTDLSAGDLVTLGFSDGTARARVESLEPTVSGKTDG